MADFFTENRNGETFEINVSHEIKTDGKAISFLIEINLSMSGFSRRHLVRLNAMEFVALVAMLQTKYDKACREAFGPNPQIVSSSPEFGSVFDEPLDTPSGSTAESMVIGALAAAELAERRRWIAPIEPNALAELADKVVSIFEAEDAAKSIGESPVPTVPSNLKLRPWIVYQGDKPLCVIPAETLDEAQSILKFQTGRFTFSLKIRQSDWSEENAVFLPLHEDWVKKMDADLAAKRAIERVEKATGATGTAVGDDGQFVGTCTRCGKDIYRSAKGDFTTGMLDTVLGNGTSEHTCKGIILPPGEGQGSEVTL